MICKTEKEELSDEISSFWFSVTEKEKINDEYMILHANCYFKNGYHLIPYKLRVHVKDKVAVLYLSATPINVDLCVSGYFINNWCEDGVKGEYYDFYPVDMFIPEISKRGRVVKQSINLLINQDILRHKKTKFVTRNSEPGAIMLETEKFKPRTSNSNTALVNINGFVEIVSTDCIVVNAGLKTKHEDGVDSKTIIRSCSVFFDNDKVIKEIRPGAWVFIKGIEELSTTTTQKGSTVLFVHSIVRCLVIFTNPKRSADLSNVSTCDTFDYNGVSGYAPQITYCSKRGVRACYDYEYTDPYDDDEIPF